MSITGEMLIGRKAVRGNQKPLRAFNPATGSELAEPVFGSGSAADVAHACELARPVLELGLKAFVLDPLPLPGSVIGILNGRFGERRGFAQPKRPVQRREFTDQDSYGPAVRDRVMHRHEGEMLAFT